MNAVDTDMNTKRFQHVDRWLTRVLRYDSTMPLTLDELYRRACKLKFEKQELLWVASTATKSTPHGPSMYRFIVERNETGIFIGLNDKSEEQHRMKKRRREEEEQPSGDKSEDVYQERGRCKEDPYR